MSPTVSIIIITYNSASYIRACLYALYEITDETIEVIVYDNCSQDGTFELIQKEYPQTKLLTSAKNVGFAAANNQAAKCSQAEILAFLNPDTVVQLNWLAPWPFPVSTCSWPGEPP